MTIATTVSGANLRDALTRHAAGVTIVSAFDTGGRPTASTVTAFTPVSLDPPLVLVCLKRDSTTLAAVRGSRRFALNVLDGQQGELALSFGRRIEPKAFDEVSWDQRPEGPAFTGVLALLRAELRAVHDGGDHVIVVGTVHALESRDQVDQALVHFDGALGPARPIVPPSPVVAEPIVIDLPTPLGDRRVIGLEESGGRSLLALVVGDPAERANVRVHHHRGCLLGDALRSTSCASAKELREQVRTMEDAGAGVVLYERDDATLIGACCTGQTTEPPQSRDLDATLIVLRRIVGARSLVRGTPELGKVDVRSESPEPN